MHVLSIVWGWELVLQKKNTACCIIMPNDLAKNTVFLAISLYSILHS